jgi:hypothetical protein
MLNIPTDGMGSILKYLREVCSESSRNYDMEQRCISHVRWCLNDLATLPLVTQASFFQMNWAFCLVL